MPAALPSIEERYAPCAVIPHHQHLEPYLALVLEGGYEECGNHGRIFARAGSVLLHSALDSHLDRFQARPTRVLNLELRQSSPSWSFATIDDPDEIVRLASRDALDAATQVLAQATAAPTAKADWIDLLAADLIEDPNVSLGRWAREHGLRAEVVSRSFQKVFGISATRFRNESRVRHARRCIFAGVESLSTIAAAAGFADQAHMTRSLLRFSGERPGQLRRMRKKVQDELTQVRST
jgi:AraC-like DNA-binding protein